MNKLNIKVSRDTSKWFKAQPDFVMEYIGELLNTMATKMPWFTWYGLQTWTAKEIVAECLDYLELESFEGLKEQAEQFCWNNGFIGYRIQSRF